MSSYTNMRCFLSKLGLLVQIVLLYFMYKNTEIASEIIERLQKRLVFIVQPFMLRVGLICNLAIIGRDFKIRFFVVCFYSLFEIVDVDQLNVKLILEMFEVCELVFCERFACYLLKLVFKMM